MIVLDASVAVDLILDTTPFSTAISTHVLEFDGDLHAPYLIDAEVGHALRRHILRGALSLERAEQAVTDLRDLPINRYSHLRFVTRALRMGASLSLYRPLYVALAESLSAPLLTRDGRLARAAGELVDVVHVS